MKIIYSILFLLAMSNNCIAQDKTKDSTKSKTYFSIGSGGIKFGKEKTKLKDTTDKPFEIQIGMLDLGFNYLQDKTNYTDPAVQNYLQVNQQLKNENLFSLREGKSINVNIYPILVKYRLLNTKKQRIYVAVGAGLQVYNFRFNKPVTYTNETVPMVVTNDSLHFTKNKLTVTYLSLPFMVNFKTKLHANAWLVYGFGITAGYRISSYTKQISEEKSKQKNHDSFNLNNFNSCVTAEIGVDGILRLFASYQLTALHDNILDQHPYTIGVRFLGI